MPNINDAFPSNYLKASDLRGQQPVVTIDRLAFEAVGRTKDMKPVLYFAGKEKGMVLNKTNATLIAQLAGTSETDEWAGIRLKLYAATVEFQGNQVEALRVKAAPPVAAGNGHSAPAPAPAAKPIHADDIPF